MTGGVPMEEQDEKREAPSALRAPRALDVERRRAVAARARRPLRRERLRRPLRDRPRLALGRARTYRSGKPRRVAPGDRGRSGSRALALRPARASWARA